MYADVVVDISYEKLDRIFQYHIPERLSKEIQIGGQVKVPFGRGNRVIQGYVVGITKESSYPKEKTKEIMEVVSGSITIETRLIQLAWWMRETYGSTMNQALKTVLPVKKQVKGKEKKKIKLLITEQEASKLLLSYQKRSKAKERLLRALLEEPEIAYDLVKEKLHISLATVKAMQEASVIEITSEELYRNPSIYKREQMPFELFLTREQQYIVEDFLANYENGRRKTCLIHGVTGSGKTEVYMEIIAGIQKKGKQAIVLIPEIALTYQTVQRFYRRFGDRVSIMNSRMSQGERYDQFQRAKNGEIDIMIGPRSALFTPFTNLGIIIIDEEHEGSYKSETVPKYHARETAEKIAQLWGACVILGSATPSIEAYFRADTGEYILYRMVKRVQERPMPSVQIVDLRRELKCGNKSIFSRILQEKIKERLEQKRQTILFINRRGYAGFVSCRACGEPLGCPHCDVSLTAHRDGTLRCHYCGYSISQPKVCPKCGSKYIAAFGTGTQKVEEAVKREFPDARVLRMDLDTTQGKDGHEKILAAFANHEADILIGTQMIVKGHDFPLVTLVGVIAADLSLYAGNYRAAERTFQLLTQAAGRAGRGKETGEVVIQTYSPEHYSIQTAALQNYEEFYEQEMLYRRLMRYPPVGRITALLIAGQAKQECEGLAYHLKNLAESLCKDTHITIIGPAEASIFKINDYYRMVIYLKQNISEEEEWLTNVKNQIEAYILQLNLSKEWTVQFDRDPMNSY